MSRRRALLAAGALSLLGACGSDDDPSASRPTTTTAPSATSAPSTTAAAATSTTPTTRAGRLDWDGVRFDYGILDRIDRTEDGRTIVVFDRGQLPGGTASENTQAADLTEEPIVAGNTDLGMVNDNTRLRSYVAGPDLEVLRIANLPRTCADRDDREDPRWERITVDDVLDDDLADELQQVSLTFDDEGFVRRIRLSSGC